MSDIVVESPTVHNDIAGGTMGAVIDTGAETSLIPYSVYSAQLFRQVELLPTADFMKLCGANGLEIPVVSYFRVPITVMGHTVDACFMVHKDDSPLDRKASYPILLGCNILHKIARLLDDEPRGSHSVWNMILKKAREPEAVPVGASVSRVVASPIFDVRVNETKGSHTIWPRELRAISCNLVGTTSTDTGVYWEGKNFRSCVVGASSVLTETRPDERSPVTVQDGFQFGPVGCEIELSVSNTSNEPMTLCPGMSLAPAMPLDLIEKLDVRGDDGGPNVNVRQVVESFNDTLDADECHVNCDGMVQDDSVLYHFSDGSHYHLPPGIVLPDLDKLALDRFVRVLQQNDAAFSRGEFDLGYNNMIPHEIRLHDDTPISVPYRRVPPHLIEEVRQQLQGLLDRGIIRKSSSPYASAVVLVKKKNGSLRICIDYRKLNDKTVGDAFPMPKIDHLYEALAGSSLFSCLDLAHGYFQVTMSPESIPYTASRVPWGLYEFLRLPQGLKNSPSTFSRVMEQIFGEFNLKELVLYMDDLLIHGASFEEHIGRVDRVLALLIKNGLKVSGKSANG